MSKLERPPHASEVPARQVPAGEEALPTSKEAPPRQLSPTGIVKMHVDDNDTKVDVATIQADVEKARIAGNLALAKLIAMWAGGAVAAFTVVAVVGLALFYGQGTVAIVVAGLGVAALAVVLGRSFMFKAPGGIGVGTGDAAAPPPATPPALPPET